MARYVITFPARTMILNDDEFVQAGIDSHAVVDELKAAGVYITASGMDPEMPAVLVSEDGTVAPASYPDTAGFNGGITIIEVETRDEAVMWAAKIAKACRCPQELREFMYDPGV